jgi:hypothetical protein
MARRGSVFTLSGPLAKVAAMTNLLTFLASGFYVALAVLIVAAIIDRRRVTTRSAAELADKQRLENAA